MTSNFSSHFESIKIRLAKETQAMLATVVESSKEKLPEYYTRRKSEEARKVERKAARARARAGDIRSSRCKARRGATACADAADGEEEEVASGQAGERASLGAVYSWAIWALLAAATAWSPATGPVLAPSPSGVHYLPRPPGVRFSGCRAPSGAEMQL